MAVEGPPVVFGRVPGYALPPMARLVIQTPDGPRTCDLRPHNTLGRHPGNSIQLLDKIVSKEHCIVERRGELFVLRDLGSLNGTYVNNARVDGEIALKDGDEISLGTTHAVFEVTPPRSSELPQVRPSAGPPTSAPVRTKQYSALGTRIDASDVGQQIGAQLAATRKGFAPFDEIAAFPATLRADYERLRLANELTVEIGVERDLDQLLQKILANVIRQVKADRGVVLLRDKAGALVPRASRRGDASAESIVISQTILDKVVRERTCVITHNASLDFAGGKAKSMILNRINSAIVAPLLHDKEHEVLGVLWLDSEALAQFQPRDLEVVQTVAQQAAMFIELTILGKKVEEEALMRERFCRLLSPNIAERVISGQLAIEQGGQRVEPCTVFNSDIRGFTTMSEGVAPEEIVDMMNSYFEEMVDQVFRFEGTLDKFMGDGIMALWGAPVAHPDDAVRSVQCALAMNRVLADFNRRRQGQGKQPIDIGIGIHTGAVVAGYIGSSKALGYTVIGDVANTSARLCGVAAPGEILVSEDTKLATGDRFTVEALPPVKLKGKDRPLNVFRVLGERV